MGYADLAGLLTQQGDDTSGGVSGGPQVEDVAYRGERFQPFNPMGPAYSNPGLHAGAEPTVGTPAGAKGTSRAPDELVGAEGMPGLVSPSAPVSPKPIADPATTYIPVSRSTMAAVPGKLEAGVGAMARYKPADGDNPAQYPGMPPGIAKMPPEEQAQAIHDHIVGNLLAIHDAQPDDVRAGSKLWYDGANKIAFDNAQKYGISVGQAAGTNAALSPQMDWYKNVSLASRVMDALTTAKQPMNQDMLQTAVNIDRAIVASGRADPKFRVAAQRLQGQTLNDMLSDPERATTDGALFVRLHDQTYNSPQYSILNPDGSPARVATNKGKDGQPGPPSNIGWGGLKQIENAIDAFRAKDMGTISDALGDRHKVRSFYNNQIYPNSPLGDVTIDTHAVAAGLLRPLSGSALEVTHNLATSGPKGSTSAPVSAVTGIKGTYPIFADAYRDAAAQRGILPREMQSITWEGVRGLFKPSYKGQASNVAAVNNLWHSHSAGRAAPEDVRRAIVEHAGGYDLPSWYTGKAGGDEE